MSATVDQIPKDIKVKWSIGALGVAFMMNTVAGLALFYLISVLLIPPAIAGAIVFIPKLFDAVTDPIVGAWSDRLGKGKSRRRPFLLAGAVISTASFVFIFTTPVFETQAFTIAYVFTGLMVFAIGYTLFNIPYMAMPAEMTTDYHERSSIHGYRVVCISIAGFIAGSGIPFLLERLGRTDWNSYALIAVGGGVLIFVTMMTSWIGTKDARFTEAQETAPKIIGEMGHVFSNGHFMRLLGIKFCQLFGVAATIAAFKYFVLYVITGNFDDLALYGLAVGVVALIAAPLVVKLSKTLGKKETYMCSAFLYILAMGSWILAVPNEPLIYILMRGAVLGVVTTTNVIMAMSILTDIINHDSMRTGVRREGVFTAFYSFIEKFTFALGPLLVGVALQWAGYDEGLSQAEKQSPEIRHAILLGVSYIPIVATAISIVLLAGYKLTEKDMEDTPEGAAQGV